LTERSNIEWTDSTWNPWLGCTEVSPGCDNCYARVLVEGRFKRSKWGSGEPRILTSTQNWKLPLKWNARRFWQCDSCGWRGDDINLMGGSITDGLASCPECDSLSVNEARRRVFCASLSDVFDNEVPITWLVNLLEIIWRTPNLDWLLVTKRIGNFQKRLIEAARFKGAYAIASEWFNDNAPSNVWLGITVVNQEEADRDIPKLLRIPARVRFLSVEPMLGPIDLQWHLWRRMALEEIPGWALNDGCTEMIDKRGLLHWVICGGESGNNARPMHPDWARSLRDQCQAAAASFFFKQWGEWTPAEGPGHRFISDGGSISNRRHASTDAAIDRPGKKAAGRLLDGCEWNQVPKVAA
jgi:protein gp37